MIIQLIFFDNDEVYVNGCGEEIVGQIVSQVYFIFYFVFLNNLISLFVI